ncbi:FAD-binding protein, partial [Candidatus Peregrinibacteria bacterium]|nr:FAD-binding protein [Candidatus Peregrinibacteria bacterium]
MNVISEHDLVIIGAGAAGLRAAISAAETDPNLNIAIISKVFPVRSHTVAAEGGIAASIKQGDSYQDHSLDTINASHFLADQDAVELFTKKCADEIKTLDQWGCPWSRDEDGSISIRKFGGMNKRRTVYASDKTGFYMLHNMFERTFLHTGIYRYDEWFVTKIFADKKNVKGVYVINLKEGTQHIILAKAIIICTGGAGQLYKNTTNSEQCTGDGMALALQAGLHLKDMEFMQFHPTAMPETGILISEAARAEGGYLLNRKNERFLKDYVPRQMELGPRDTLVKAILEEYQKGNGLQKNGHQFMLLDLRHLGTEKINEKLAHIKELVIDYMGIDPTKEPIPVTPAQHYTMGGIHTNIDCETTIPGLYAAGESACISIHGSNRLGSNSLAECLVFGKIAGQNAANFCQNKDFADIKVDEVEDENNAIHKKLNQRGTKNIFEIKAELKDFMETHAGIIRDHKSLLKALEKIQTIKEHNKEIEIKQKNLVFNYEFTSLIELEGMLDLAEAIILSAEARRESRGSHLR